MRIKSTQARALRTPWGEEHRQTCSPWLLVTFFSRVILGQGSELLGQTYRSDWPDAFDFTVIRFPGTNPEARKPVQL